MYGEAQRPALDADTLFEILENIYNEIYVIDRNMQIIYVNQACTKHYGLLPRDMRGHNHMEFVGNLWYPSVIPRVFAEKCALSVEQVTYTGQKIVATANPVFNDQGEIEMVVCVTEEQLQHFDIQYNPQNKGVAYADKSSDQTVLPVHCGLIASNATMKALLNTAKQCAQRDITVLIQGDSGTGKSMLANYIHQASPRKNGPFTAINCAAITESLLETELFGCAPHAFTGAPPKGKTGLFEASNGGTLFLDEIGELPLSIQAKLLGVLENKKFIPVGGKEEKTADVRIISATNRNLPSMVAQKLFREDLFWRLDVMDLYMPPLRERYDEIGTLAEQFLNQFNAKYHVTKTLTQEAVDALLFYDWPGNIRQLKNLVERLVITSQEDTIQLQDIPGEILHAEHESITLIRDFTKYQDACAEKIISGVWKAGMTSRQVAEKLQISQSTANRLIQKYIHAL